MGPKWCGPPKCGSHLTLRGSHVNSTRVPYGAHLNSTWVPRGASIHEGAPILPGVECGALGREEDVWLGFFSFLNLKKIKISKIYVRFEILQKYTPVALP